MRPIAFFEHFVIKKIAAENDNRSLSTNKNKKQKLKRMIYFVLNNDVRLRFYTYIYNTSNCNFLIN